MSNIVQIDDFVGFNYISTNHNCSNMLQSYIDKYEDYYLCMLMGNDLKDLFIDDLLNEVPQDANYLTIYNSFCEVLTGCNCQSELMHSQGLKRALAGLIFYHFVSNEHYSHTLTGVVVSYNENSTGLDSLNVERFAEKRWNDAVESYNSIAYKIKDLGLYDKPITLEYKFLDIVYMWLVGLVNNFLYVIRESDGFLIDNPKDYVYFRRSHNNSTKFSLYYKYGTGVVAGEGVKFSQIDISQIKSLNGEFTDFNINSFEQFNTSNLGFKSASGGSEAVSKIKLVATNYNDLINQDSTENVPDNSIAYIEQSQGTKWLSFGLGGTYYPAGWYLKISGNWTSDRNDISEELDRIGVQLSDTLIRVKTSSDLFNKSLLGNVVYFVDNDGVTQPSGQSIWVGENGLNLAGYTPKASKITSSEDGTYMFIVDPSASYSGSLNFDGITIQGSGTNSRIFNLDNQQQTDNENNNIDWLNLNFVNCSDLGVINNYRQGFWSVGSSIFCGGLLLNGTWSGGFRISQNRTLHSGIVPFLKQSPTLTFNGRFFTDVFFTGFGSHGGFCGCEPDNILKDGDFEIVGGRFETSGSTSTDLADFFPNMPISSTKAYFDSIGIEKTNVGGRIRFTAQTATTIPSAGTWVKLAGTTTLINPQWTSATGNNQLNYISDQPISGSVVGAFSMSGGVGDNIGIRIRHYRLATNDTVTLDEAYGEVPLFGTISINVLGFAEFRNGDYTFIEGTNLDDTSSITANIGSKYILSRR